MKIIVTGGCGYVGSLLVPELLELGHEVLVLDVQWFGNHLSEHPMLTVRNMDIRTVPSDWVGSEQVMALPTHYDAVIHLAAVANDPSADLDPSLAWEVNVLGTLNMLKAAKSMSARRFIYASSGSVYGVSEAVSVNENTPLVPISLYNKTKMVAERLVKSFSDKLETVILRPGTLYGVSPRMRLDLMVNALTCSAATKNLITVDGGSQIRPILHVQDMVRAYIWALNKYVAGPEVYNVSDQNITAGEAAARIGDLLDKVGGNVSIRIEPSNDPRSYRMDNSRILNAGFESVHGLDAGVMEVRNAIVQKLVVDDPICHNIRWMKNYVFVKDLGSV